MGPVPDSSLTIAPSLGPVPDSSLTIAPALGPVPDSSLTIAPAFYHTQLDLSGPYKAYSPRHKRTTVKIWLVV